jgi:hypothetical protein
MKLANSGVSLPPSTHIVRGKPSRGDEQASIVEHAVAVEFNRGAEHHAVDVHSREVDTAHTRARAEREVDGADHLLVLD